MKEAIRDLVFVSILLFSVSYDCLVTGVNYDTKHQLFAEATGTCMIEFGYGHRWKRLGTAAFLMGTVVLITTFLAAVKKEENLKLPSILGEK